MKVKDFLEKECYFEVSNKDRKIEMDQSRLLAMIEGYSDMIMKPRFKKIIKEEYEKRFGTQKYESSVLHSTFEDVVISAMKRIVSE